MQEIELKFLIPESRLKGLMRQAKVKSSQTTQLAAHYYDTPKQTLAKAGIGLRIRQEGEQWVQTIKAGGDGIAARLEHNVILDSEQVQTMLDEGKLFPDLSVYKETAIAPALADFKLKKLAKNLTRQYVTDVQRVSRLLEDKESSQNEETNNTIEIAYDCGEIIHGSDATLRYPIHEIEFELVSGELEFLFATAKVWCKRYKLCLSTVTKAERGGLLIQQQDYSPAVSANLAQLNVNPDSSMAEFIRATVHNCLLQILPNSSAIVAGSTDNDHVLQLRIGIRRLRTALNVLKKFSDAINPDWQPILKQTERLLGDYRALAYLASDIECKLQQQGAPKVDWSTELTRLKVTPTNAVRANDFQLTLLELIEFTMSDASNEPQAKMLAIDILPKLLSKKHIKLLKAEQKLADLKNPDAMPNKLASDELSNDVNIGDADNEADKKVKITDQKALHNTLQHKAHHKVCQHLKDLRYISEFAAPLYSDKKNSSKKSRRLIEQLVKAQRALGQYNDHQQYQQHYEKKALTDTNALYGAGWFAALTKSDLQRCQKRLAKVNDVTIFW